MMKSFFAVIVCFAFLPLHTVFADSDKPICQGSAVDASMLGTYQAHTLELDTLQLLKNQIVLTHQAGEPRAMEAWTCQRQGGLFLVIKFPDGAGFESRLMSREGNQLRFYGEVVERADGILSLRTPHHYSVLLHGEINSSLYKDQSDVIQRI